jgi:hypothetical protein
MSQDILIQSYDELLHLHPSAVTSKRQYADHGTKRNNRHFLSMKPRIRVYLEKLAHCELIAKSADDPCLKELYQELANHWSELASDAEFLDGISREPKMGQKLTTAEETDFPPPYEGISLARRS